MYRTKCGHTILVPTNAALHLQAHPEVFDLLEETVGSITLPLNGGWIATDVDLGRIVGRSGCLSTPLITTSTKTTFARRLNRLKPSRVAVDAIGPEIGHVVLIAKPTERTGVYDLVTAYVGSLAPKEPWDPTLSPEEKVKSVRFWNEHALVYDPAVMEPPLESTWDAVLEN